MSFKQINVHITFLFCPADSQCSMNVNHAVLLIPLTFFYMPLELNQCYLSYDTILRQKNQISVSTFPSVQLEN